MIWKTGLAVYVIVAGVFAWSLCRAAAIDGEENRRSLDTFGGQRMACR
jgi:hypothetical protein